MLIPYVPNGSRIGNVFNNLVLVIVQNLLHYKHHEISTKLLKIKFNNFIKNFPDFLIFDEFENNTTICDISQMFETNLDIIEHIPDIMGKNVINKYIKPWIDYEFDFDSCPINFDNDLIIHIRSKT